MKEFKQIVKELYNFAFPDLGQRIAMVMISVITIVGVTASLVRGV